MARSSVEKKEEKLGQPIPDAASGFFIRQLRRWRSDPAYAVLALAIVLVVIVALVFTSVGVSALLAINGGPQWSSAQTQHPSLPTPAGTIDTRPRFPTPATGGGSSISSQPVARPTPTLRASPTLPPDQGTLSVEIISIPDVVNNKSQVQVEVQASEPGVTVRLQVIYDASPFYYNSNKSTTNHNGNATLYWNVRVSTLLNGNNVQARVVVVAIDRNGQQAVSQEAMVLITG